MRKYLFLGILFFLIVANVFLVGAEKTTGKFSVTAEAVKEAEQSEIVCEDEEGKGFISFIKGILEKILDFFRGENCR